MMFRALRPTKEWMSLICGVTATVLLIGTTPYFDIPYLSFIAFVPLVLLTHIERTRRRILWTAFAVGTAYGVVILLPLMSLEGWWFAVSNAFYTWRLYVWGAGLLAVAVALSGLVFGLFFSLLASRIKSGRRMHVPAVLFFSALWGILEYVRGTLIFDSSWGHLGYTLHHSEALLQLLPAVGVYGLSAFVVLINILLAQILLHTTRHRARHGHLLGGLQSAIRTPAAALLLIAFGGALTYGQDMYRTINATGANGTPISVAVLNTRLSHEDARGNAGFARYRELLAEAADGTDVVVAPESIFHPIEIDRTTSLPVAYHDDALPIRARYDALLDMFRAYPETSFVLGLKTRSGEDRYNSIVVYRNGAITDMYDKRTLLPFAEKNASLHNNRLTPALTPGAHTQTFAVHGYPAHALICSEIIHSRVTSSVNATLTMSVSNEDSFSSPLVAKYNHTMARFRAVETRSYVLRAVKDGTSSIIAPTGDEIAISEDADTEILRGTIRIPK